MIHNPKKANPYGLRRFVKNLRFILIEKRGYDFAWGCPLEVDDPRYPVVGGDKRFEMHRELTFKDEDGEIHLVFILRSYTKFVMKKGGIIISTLLFPNKFRKISLET